MSTKIVTDQAGMLHILRNPYGFTEEAVREARLRAADRVEELERELAALNAEKCDAITWVMWKQRAEKAEAALANEQPDPSKCASDNRVADEAVSVKAGSTPAGSAPPVVPRPQVDEEVRKLGCNCPIPTYLHDVGCPMFGPDASPRERRTDEALRELAKRHARKAVAPAGSLATAYMPSVVMQNITRQEEIIFYALKEANDGAPKMGMTDAERFRVLAKFPVAFVLRKLPTMGFAFIADWPARKHPTAPTLEELCDGLRDVGVRYARAWPEARICPACGAGYQVDRGHACPSAAVPG